MPLQGGRSVHLQDDVVLSPALIHMSPLQREPERWNWIADGTQQCGKRKWEEIRKSGWRSGEKVKTDKSRGDRKSEGGPTPRSEGIDVRGGINSWIQLQPRWSFVTAARGWRLSPRRPHTAFLSPSLPLCCHYTHTLSQKLGSSAEATASPGAGSMADRRY